MTFRLYIDACSRIDIQAAVADRTFIYVTRKRTERKRKVVHTASRTGIAFNRTASVRIESIRIVDIDLGRETAIGGGRIAHNAENAADKNRAETRITVRSISGTEIEFNVSDSRIHRIIRQSAVRFYIDLFVQSYRSVIEHRICTETKLRDTRSTAGTDRTCVAESLACVDIEVYFRSAAVYHYVFQVFRALSREFDRRIERIFSVVLLCAGREIFGKFFLAVDRCIVLICDKILVIRLCVFRCVVHSRNNSVGTDLDTHGIFYNSCVLTENRTADHYGKDYCRNDRRRNQSFLCFFHTFPSVNCFTVTFARGGHAAGYHFLNYVVTVFVFLLGLHY